MKLSITLLSIGLSMVTAVAASAQPADDAKSVRAFLDAHCIRCHGKKNPEGDVSLNAISLDSKQPRDIETWRWVYDHIWNGQMPPLDVKQPRSSERQAALFSIKSRLKAAGMEIDELRDLLPNRGNWIDHDALFSGQIVGAAGTPSRLWRLSPESYRQFFARIDRQFSLELWRTDSFDTRFLSPWSLTWKWDFADYSALHRVSDAEYEHHLRNCRALAKRLRHMPHLAAVLRAGKSATSEQRQAAVVKTYEVVLRLPLDPDRVKSEEKYLGTLLESLDASLAVEQFLVSVLCHPEVLYRIEEPDGGAARGPMAARHTARARSFTLTEREPDAVLWQAVVDGKLATNTAVRAQVERILNDPAIPKPRIMRFFQEYFGYTSAPDIAKSPTTLTEMQVLRQHESYDAGHFVSDTDRFVEWVLESDQDVLRTLLTSRKAFWKAKYPKQFQRDLAYVLVEKKHNAERAAKEGKPLDETGIERKLKELEITSRREFLGEVISKDIYGIQRPNPELHWNGIASKGALITKPRTPAPDIEDWLAGKPYDAHPEERIGILTQASWLVSMGSNFDNHPVHRGRWIRERLLGGRILEVPITVNAMLPDEPHRGLRDRMRVTREEYCWKCHQKVDPLGFPFEQYDHFGRYREKEIVVNKEITDKARAKNPLNGRTMMNIPIDTSGAITDSGDPKLDGPVKGPFDLMEKLAQSQRVEQVFVRHVFRYFLGRNETLADGPVLVAAHKAYRESNGSFKALLVSLLTSDAFLYRTAPVLAKNSP